MLFVASTAVVTYKKTRTERQDIVTKILDRRVKHLPAFTRGNYQFKKQCEVIISTGGHDKL
ncbi:MAG: hypothetical protein PHS31_04390 [Victivallaceae bacterium]|nr:hypothetical protein [Victivallaceae bacterium]